MDVLNGAIDSLISSSNKEDWTPVALSVADATVTISKDKVGHTSVIAILLSLCYFLCPVWICIYNKTSYTLAET